MRENTNIPQGSDALLPRLSRILARQPIRAGQGRYGVATIQDGLFRGAESVVHKKNAEFYEAYRSGLPISIEAT